MNSLERVILEWPESHFVQSIEYRRFIQCLPQRCTELIIKVRDEPSIELVEPLLESPIAVIKV